MFFVRLIELVSLMPYDPDKKWLFATTLKTYWEYAHMTDGVDEKLVRYFAEPDCK